MKIISFLNSKGGVGKTTIAINLAKCLYLHKSSNIGIYKYRRARVLLVDADPVGNLRDWHESGEQTDIDVIGADRKHTLSGLPSLLHNQLYDYVLIDTPGKVGDIAAVALRLADVCLIPISPSPHDWRGTQDMIELIEVRREATGGLPPAGFVINRARQHTNLCKDLTQKIMGSPLSVVGRPIIQRGIFAESAEKGKTVFESNDTHAQAEIYTLMSCLLTSIGDK